MPAYRTVAGDLKLSYAQFVELERFSRYGTRLEEDKRKTLERGRRVREVLKQPINQPLAPGEQMATLLAVTEGLLDDVPAERIDEAELSIRHAVTERAREVVERIERGEKLSAADREKLRAVISESLGARKPDVEHGNHRETTQSH